MGDPLEPESLKKLPPKAILSAVFSSVRAFIQTHAMREISNSS